MTATAPDRRVIVARKILEQEEYCGEERLPMAHSRLVSAVWMLLDVIREMTTVPASAVRAR